MEEEMIYELFVRHAFNVGRSEDPGRLASADYFNERSIGQAKAAVAYAMAVYEARNDLTTDIEPYINRVISARNLSDIIPIIREFQTHLN